MKPRHFLNQLDDARIVAAITAAERNSSAEIRVYVSRKKRDNVLEAAQARFRSFGMDHTPDRKSVLLYFAPRTDQFAIWGDRAAHEKCGKHFWDEITAEMTLSLKNGQLTEAIEHALKKVGEALAAPPGAWEEC